MICVEQGCHPWTLKMFDTVKKKKKEQFWFETIKIVHIETQMFYKSMWKEDLYA